ncbi:MAG: hypothetical protein P9L94_18570 [Candidatus Hinthialibacter antarcticus]|nr:hypothetical protein [Candidatus Hinthialibacter antarcticus]
MDNQLEEQPPALPGQNDIIRSLSVPLYMGRFWLKLTGIMTILNGVFLILTI